MSTVPVSISIEEHHEQQPSSQKSGERCHAIFENAPFGICMTGMDMRFLQANGALCLMLGYSAEELLEAPWSKLIHPDDLGPLLERIERLILEPGVHLKAQNRLIHRNGADVWVRMGTSLLRDSGGDPLFFVFQMEDITEHKRATAVLRDNQERFKAIADNCPSMMFELDAEGNIRYLNRAARRFSGIVQENLDASEWQSIVHPDDALEYIKSFKTAIREHAPFSAEARILRADGEWRMLGSRAEPRFSPEGEYLGHIGLSADITDRVHTEQSREFELLLNRAIHNETLMGILVVNSAGEIVSRNKRFLAIWGLTDSEVPEQLTGYGVGAPDKSLLQAVVDRVEAPEAFANRIRELYNHPDEDDHCEVRLKDGRTLERHSTGLRTQEGKYLGRVWFFRDISAHRQAEINLREAKELADDANRRLETKRSIIENERNVLHALIDNIPDFMYVKDLESRFMVANPHLASVVGVTTPEEMVGKSDFDYFSPELATGFYEDEQKVIRSGLPLYNREEKGIDSEGNEVDILTTKVPIRDSEGRMIGIAGVGRDITERKKMEMALHEAERKYRGMFDNALIGVFQSTPDGRFLSVNPALASTFGYDSPEEMIAGVTDISQQCYADPKRREEFLTLLRASGGVQNFVGEARRKDGTTLWGSMNVRAIQENGVVVRFEGMCEDVTERNQLREQLLQAQKLESVGQLASGIAHEINTPTQYIGDNVRFLKDAFHDLKSLLASYQQLLLAAQSGTLSCDEIQEVAAVVERTDAGYLLEEIPKAIDQSLEGITRVATLVSAMKEFSHPGTKEKIPLDLNHAINSTITVARNEWKYVAEVDTDFDPSLPLIPCLPGEFNQVILNLIINAAHAIDDANRKTGQEKGRIKIQTLNSPGWAEIRIQDTGSGIPEEIRSRVFDPFFTTKEIGKGTGQGLAIARSVVVDKHGGSIHFESKEGKGTTFIIRLPLDGKALVPKAVAA